MLASRLNAALIISCSYCCGDLLVADGEQAACRYCGNPAPGLVPRDAASDWTASRPGRRPLLGIPLVVDETDRFIDLDLSVSSSRLVPLRTFWFRQLRQNGLPAYCQDHGEEGATQVIRGGIGVGLRAPPSVGTSVNSDRFSARGSVVVADGSSTTSE